jgi:hypothetical protein
VTLTVTVTFFDDSSAQTKREENLALGDLAGLIPTTSAPQKSALPWLKLANFGEVRTRKGSLRHEANIKAISGIEADYDAGRMPFGDVVTAVGQVGVTAVAGCARFVVQGDDIGAFGRELRRGREVDR